MLDFAHGEVLRLLYGYVRYPPGCRIEAESMYEAAALVLKAFKEHELEPGGLANLEVEIRKTITHTLTGKKLHEWLNGGWLIKDNSSVP